MTDAIERARALIKDLADTVRECHCHAGGWALADPEDHAAKALHDEAVQLVDELAGIAPIVMTHLDPMHAAVKLRLANLTGASAALLKAIHDAGGYHVFDPGRQADMAAKMKALATATAESLAHHTHPED